jgi:transposase
MPRRPLVRQFNVHLGQCRNGSRHLQGRHPLQTPDALGAAASQLGPDAQAAIVLLNKELGLSHGKVVHCLDRLFGIRVSRSGSVHTVLRAARRCRPVARAIRRAVRDSPWAVGDETGWRVGGRGVWLPTVVGEHATWYGIYQSRSAAVAAWVLGTDYAGTLLHDGWASYDCRFKAARHQQCVQHLLQRCRDLLAVATRGAVCFPRAVAALPRRGLRLRDRYAAGS